jgi:hypothetical protein
MEIMEATDLIADRIHHHHQHHRIDSHRVYVSLLLFDLHFNQSLRSVNLPVHHVRPAVAISVSHEAWNAGTANHHHFIYRHYLTWLQIWAGTKTLEINSGTILHGRIVQERVHRLDLAMPPAAIWNTEVT